MTNKCISGEKHGPIRGAAEEDDQKFFSRGGAGLVGRGSCWNRPGGGRQAYWRIRQRREAARFGCASDPG